MNFLSLCSGCGGMDLGLEQAGMKCVGQVEIMPYALIVLKRHWKNVPKHTDVSTLLRSDSLVRIYRQRIRREGVYRAKKALSSLNVYELSDTLHRNGYSSKMFPDYFQLTEDGTLQLSCKRFPNAGMGIHGTFWTLNTLESPKDASVCSLADVLEESVHPRYYLSQRAIAGIIKRSERYGKTSGYVFLREKGNGTTTRLTRISLQRFKSLKTSSQELSERDGGLETQQQAMTILSQKQSTQTHEDTAQQMTQITLRKLTPTEKERLQGFPEGWTKIEE